MVYIVSYINTTYIIVANTIDNVLKIVYTLIVTEERELKEANEINMGSSFWVPSDNSWGDRYMYTIHCL